MKTILSLSTLLLVLASACAGSQVTPQDVTNTISDAVACGLGVVAVAQGAPINVQQLLSCGLTVSDAIALVTKLRGAASPADAGAAALAPAQVAYVKSLDQALADLQALQAKGALKAPR